MHLGEWDQIMKSLAKTGFEQSATCKVPALPERLSARQMSSQKDIPAQHPRIKYKDLISSKSTRTGECRKRNDNKRAIGYGVKIIGGRDRRQSGGGLCRAPTHVPSVVNSTATYPEAHNLDAQMETP
ncbi:hypothetical protein L484_015503 [Morus notabilis]|uniref:Uncharacterized protein n=1 Tax=Morus notabilis TaxID=981085 RepID=W9RS20_9ROSA|nr:hypothetical protein L484_015503 [Morus notabilis]